MVMNPTAAANAYTSVANLTDKASTPSPANNAPVSSGTFQDLLTNAVSSVADTGKAAEAQAVDLANGKTDIVNLVTAVAETELALETVVTVRDRMISAYQDILNMPI